MSSKGNPRVTVRLPVELLAQLEVAVVEVNQRRLEEPYDLSSLIRKALEDWLAHRERGKVKRPGKARGKQGKDAGRHVLIREGEGDKPEGK